MTYELFGIEVNGSINLKKDYADTFVKHMRQKGNTFDTLYTEYCDYNDLDPDGGFETEFLEDYESDEGNLYGFYGLMATLMNDELKSPWFEYEDSCLGVAATLPADEDDKQNIPSRKQITEMLCDYFTGLTNEPITVPDWLEINI